MPIHSSFSNKAGKRKPGPLRGAFYAGAATVMTASGLGAAVHYDVIKIHETTPETPTKYADASKYTFTENGLPYMIGEKPPTLTEQDVNGLLYATACAVDPKACNPIALGANIPFPK